MPFLPALRGKARAVQPQPLGGDLPVEGKAVYSDYFGAIARAASTGSYNRPWSVERAVTEGYERLVWGFRSVEAISSASSSLRYRLRSGADVVDDDPVCHLLNVRANPLETGWVFRKRLSALALLSKPGVFVETTRSNRDTPVRYDILPVGSVKIVPGSNGIPIDHFEMWLGGRKVKDLDPRNVHWVRNPHPSDPYSGVTPLEAAGLSIELDHYARLYNVTFLRNDGRPGGIVGVGGVDEDVDDTVLDAIEARFDKGPHNAGKLTAVAGQLSYVDLGAKPRDAQYGTLAQNAKTEILVAFGVPESQIGNASQRTFANAEEEGYAYWTQTMASHNRMVITPFEDDSPLELRGFLDTSEVEALQAPIRARRQEALGEFNAGLRSIKSYADLAGYGDEIDDTPETRALYLPSGKTPIATRATDKSALGLDSPAGGGGGDGPAAPGEAPPGQAAAAAVDRVQGALDGTAPAARTALQRITGGDGAPATPAAAAVTAARARPALPPAAPTASVGASLFGKHGGGRVVKARPPVRLVVDRKAIPAGRAQSRESETDEAHAARVEAEVTAALAALVDRWVERTVARLHAPKTRKGTRHFLPEHPVDTRVGIKALDAARITDEDRFAAEAQAVVWPLLAAAAGTAAARVAGDLAAGDAAATVTGAAPLLLGGVAATRSLLDTPDQAPGGLSAWLWQVVKVRAVARVLDLVGASAARVAARLADAVNTVDQAGGTVTDIEGVVRAWGAHATGWAAGLAEQATTGTVEGARAVTVPAVVGGEQANTRREWVTRRDGKVRPTHHDADRQQVGVDEPFKVGDAALMYPGDPDGPPAETANCRCRVRYRHRVTGRFLPVSAGTVPASG